MPTYRIDLSYDGAGFHGYARQPGMRTVQGDLEYALGRVVGEVATEVAGRTDAGVHARGQVVTFTTAEPVDLDRVHRALVSMLGPEVGVESVVPAADGFSPRFAASHREYRYRILDRPVPDPFRRAVVWHVVGRLDVDAMNAAAAHVVGLHDFASFCRRSPGRSTERMVRSARWDRVGDEVVFRVVGSSFCHQMVRAMVALMVEVGQGRRSADEVPVIMAAAARSSTTRVAPAHGLILWEVGYPDASPA